MVCGEERALVLMKNHNEIYPQKILLVDDEEQMREIMHEAISIMGHDVKTAGDGHEALEIIQENIFDIVITDIHMPRMSGMQLIEFLSNNHPEIDIVAITGHSVDYTYTDVVRNGASDFIIKPFSFDEMEAKLRRIARERSLRRKLEQLAVRDSLTGLYNRRYFEDSIRKEAARASRYRYPLVLFFIDIDRFKIFNDEKGHRAGDEALIQFARVLQQCVRSDVDIACRYGGDEFVLLLPHIEPREAVIVADRIRERYNDLGFAPTRLSIGMAQLQVTGDLEKDVETLIHQADKAQYHVKHNLGGDRAIFNTTAHYEEAFQPAP